MTMPTLPKIEPVAYWRAAWRLVTVQVGAAAVIFGSLDPQTQAAVLELLHVPANRVPAVLGLAIIVGRLIKQNKGDNA